MSDFTGADVLAARKALNLSRTAFAKKVGGGLTHSQLNNIEHMRREMKAHERELLRPFINGDASSNVIVLPVSRYLNEEGSSIYGQHEPTQLKDVFHLTDVGVLLLDQDEEAWTFDPHFNAKPDIELVIDDPVQVNTLQDVLSTPVQQVEPQPEEVHLDLLGVQGLYRNDHRLLTNSEIQTFKHCKRKWWLAWYRGLKLKQEKVTGALALGTRIHEALAAYYQPNHTGIDPEEALERLIEADELKLVKSLNDQPAVDAATALSDFKSEADLARAMMEGYKQWLAEEGADQGYQVVAPEQRLTVVIETPSGADLELTGTIDLRLYREHDQVILFMDHKTTQSFSQLTNMLVWDEQMQHYRILEEGNRPEGAPHVDGALYNMLRKVKRGATAKPPFFMRVEVRHNQHQQKNFKNRLIGEAWQLQQTEETLNRGSNHHMIVPPSPSQRCLWGCEFKTVCPMFDDGSRAEDFITNYYDTVNPMARYNTDDKHLEA